MHLMKDLLQKKKRDYFIKIELKDSYVSTTLDKNLKKYIRFPWEGNLYALLFLSFDLGPAPLIFIER